MIPIESTNVPTFPVNDFEPNQYPVAEDIETYNKVSTRVNVGEEAVREADRIADVLVAAFGSAGSREFYCKVAYSLTWPTIEELIQKAQTKGNNPGALFNFLARQKIAD